MKRVVMAIKDLATQLYGQPFFVLARGQGMRTFNDEINRQAPDNGLWTHPEDYELYELGTFDDEKGTFDAGELGGPTMITRERRS